MFDRFTPAAKKAMRVSREEAVLRRHERIDVTHMLLGLLRLPSTEPALRALTALRTDLALLRHDVETSLAVGAASPVPMLPFTPAAKRALEWAMQESLDLGDAHIGSEHLLLGLVRDDRGTLGATLQRHSLALGQVRQCVVSFDPREQSPGL